MGKRNKDIHTLPSAVDFDPDGGFLDAQAAWREFGGLSIQEALAKFIDNPIHYQEYFMFMGGKAFAYYFPVLDRYLREFKIEDDTDDDDSYAAIIGAGISMQLISRTSPELQDIVPRIIDLAKYVRDNCHLLAGDPDEQQRIDSYWQILQTQLPNTNTDNEEED